LTRHGFVEAPHNDPAFLYQDVVVSLDADGLNNGEPSLHAMCIAALRPQKGDHIVHVGAGTGYYTTILAKLVGERGVVDAYEIEPRLVRRAAQRLLLLQEALDALEAGEPADAVLRIEGDPEFGPRVAEMDRRWARERGMRLEVTEERAGRRFRLAATVSGFAALRTLAPESGFHVLEIPDGRGGIRLLHDGRRQGAIDIVELIGSDNRGIRRWLGSACGVGRGLHDVVGARRHGPGVLAGRRIGHELRIGVGDGWRQL